MRPSRNRTGSLNDRLRWLATEQSNLAGVLLAGDAPRCRGGAPAAVRRIAGAVALVVGVPLRATMTGTRAGRLPLARQITVAIGRRYGFSYADLGKVFGMTEAMARSAEYAIRLRVRQEPAIKKIFDQAKKSVDIQESSDKVIPVS